MSKKPTPKRKRKGNAKPHLGWENYTPMDKGQFHFCTIPAMAEWLANTTERFLSNPDAQSLASDPRLAELARSLVASLREQAKQLRETAAAVAAD